MCLTTVTKRYDPPDPKVGGGIFKVKVRGIICEGRGDGQRYDVTRNLVAQEMLVL